MTLVHPEDLESAAEVVVAALQPAIGQDWSTKAGGLDWTVDFTIAHMAGGAAKAGLYLASRSTRFIAIGMGRWANATQADQLRAITGAAAALANVARTSPAGARGFHTAGMLDAEGHVVKACMELFAHAFDVATGLNLSFEPPEELCERIVARVFPWVDDTGPAWETLLRLTGRLNTSGDDSWVTVLIPLAEWDGTIPSRDPRPLIEWVLDDGAWKPLYLEES